MRWIFAVGRFPTIRHDLRELIHRMCVHSNQNVAQILVRVHTMRLTRRHHRLQNRKIFSRLVIADKEEVFAPQSNNSQPV